ncbi:MAG: elongation factor Ts [Gemmatales bacterium]|nr:MAG: elongation factor Ts [Gemmatales bacterium]
MAIAASDVKILRERTNAPMMDCKKALTEAGGDMEKAVEILLKQNKAIQDKKGGRETAEGRIAAFIDPEKKVGALVEMRCESAPVAKGEDFVKLANQLAKHVAFKNPATVEELLQQPFVEDESKTVNDRISEVIGLIRENMKPARFVRLEGTLGSYVHHDGSIGVLVQVEGGNANEQMLRDICMHITAKNPVAATRDDIPPERLEREKEIAKTQAASTGKPDNIVEKIAEGKMKTWFAEHVLLEQPFVKDDSKTVGQLLDSVGAKLVKFVRMKLGENE